MAWAVIAFFSARAWKNPVRPLARRLRAIFTRDRAARSCLIPLLNCASGSRPADHRSPQLAWAAPAYSRSFGLFYRPRDLGLLFREPDLRIDHALVTVHLWSLAPSACICVLLWAFAQALLLPTGLQGGAGCGILVCYFWAALRERADDGDQFGDRYRGLRNITLVSSHGFFS